MSNVSYGGTHVSRNVDAVAEVLVKHDKYLSFVKTFIKECDVGIADIKIFKYAKPDGKTKYFPNFIHLAGGKMHKLTGVTESSGTKTLFSNLLEYKLVLDSGGVLVLDEFDMYLHPHILPKLLELFITPELNPNKAQLIFSTHNSDVLNTLGRYRSYLVNKIDNESFAYRLDEIPGDVLRNDRPILPAYNDGKIGGIPKL
jgi:AAA15 family ATPase/GTPase